MNAVNSQSKTRLPHIDLLKCLALYFVLVFHGTLYPYYVNAGASAVQLLRMFSRTLLSTCVPLFFFVNGFLLFGRPLDIARHGKKTLRLLLVTSFWMVFLLVVMQPVYGEYMTGKQLTEQFWNLRDGWNNHLWYMGVLVCLYVFFPLLKQTFDTNRKVFHYFTAVTFVLVFGNTLLNELVTVFNRVVLNQTLVYDNFPFFHMFNPYGGNLGMAMVYFCMGGIALELQQTLQAVPVRKRNLLAGGGLFLSCSLLLCLGYGYSILLGSTWDVVWNGYDTVFTLCSVACLYVLSLNYRKELWLVQAISSNTLGIYFLHGIFHALLGPRFSAVAWLRNVPGTMLYGLVLLAVCLAICLVVKKIPVLRKLI